MKYLSLPDDGRDESNTGNFPPAEVTRSDSPKMFASVAPVIQQKDIRSNSMNKSRIFIPFSIRL